MQKTVAAVLLLAGSLLLFAEEPDAVYKQGLAKLREAQADHSALVPATKLLAQAAELYEKAGDEAKVAEVNSCLYWAKKKMTLADTEVVKSHSGVVGRLETAAKPIATDQAQAMFDKADAFANGHADDPLLVAIHYFEVADRFRDSDAGKKAMDLSLKAMQKVGEKAKLAEYKPQATDGKVFVNTEPPGAAIVLVTADGGKLDTGKVTPALVQLPVGRQSLELTLKAYKPATLALEVDGKAIAKPDAVKMEPLTIPIDVIFEPGWQVFVDGKPAKAVGADRTETPCTAELPLGRHELGLGKEGFLDIKQAVEIVEAGVKSGPGMPQTQVQVKTRPSKGKSILMTDLVAPVAPSDLVYDFTKLAKEDVARDWVVQPVASPDQKGLRVGAGLELKQPVVLEGLEVTFRLRFVFARDAAAIQLGFGGDKKFIWGIGGWGNHRNWAGFGDNAATMEWSYRPGKEYSISIHVKQGNFQYLLDSKEQGVMPISSMYAPGTTATIRLETAKGQQVDVISIFIKQAQKLPVDGKAIAQPDAVRTEKPVEQAVTKATDSERVPPVAADAETLKAMIREAKTPEDARKIAEAAMQLCLKAVAIDDYVTAESAVADASSLAQQIKDAALFKRTQQLLTDVATMKSGFARVRKDLETLKGNQDDGPANLAVGKYYCCVKGNWKSGIPYLAKGSDAALRALASEELKDKLVAESLAAAGSSWWEQVAKLGGLERQNVQQHAVGLYLRAQPGLDGVQRLKVDKRLSDVFAVNLEEIFNHGLVVESVSPSEQVGGGGGNVPSIRDFAFAVGAKLGKGSFDGHAIIRTLQPMMRTKNGLEYRPKMGGGEPALEVMAKPGYALGGVMVNKGPKRINGLRFVFMRAIGPLLDPADKYESEWIGERAENAVSLSANGKMVVGFTGWGGADLDSIGIVFLEKWGFAQ